MKKFLVLFLVVAFALVSGLFAPKSAEAVPAFARQVGMPCFACHYQYIPQLNSFGRSFKMGGFAQTSQDTIKDEGFDLPPNLNGAVMIGSTITLGGTGGPNGNNTGNWQIGNDATLFFGGRIGPDMGGLVEVAEAGIAKTKFALSHDFGGIQGGLVIYKTDGGGPAYAMEMFNTGSSNTHAGWSGGGDIMINQAYGPQTSAAEGLMIFAGSGLFTLNVGLFAPVGDNFNGVGTLTGTGGTGANAGLNFNDYYRIAITPTVGGIDLMVGIQGTMGTATVDQGGMNIKIDTSSMMVDLQAQMDLGGMPTQITAVFGSVPANGGAGSNNLTTATVLGTIPGAVAAYGSALYNMGAKDISGMDITASFAVSKALGVKAMYGSITNCGGGTNSLSGLGIGAWLNIAQNVNLAVEDVLYSGDLAALGHDPSITTIEFRYDF
jgi:hypothetical protein